MTISVESLVSTVNKNYSDKNLCTVFVRIVASFLLSQGTV